MRAFFAVNLPGEVRSRIAQVLATVRTSLDGEPIRWVDPAAIHLTLRFLGATTTNQADGVLQAANERARSWLPFDVELAGLGCFPDLRRPRVLWIGARDSGSLARIAADLEAIARRNGFAPEDRPFSPHLTVGRVKGRLTSAGESRLTSVIGESEARSFGTFRVESVDLMKSDLRPAGPIYTRLGAVLLGPGEAVR